MLKNIMAWIKKHKIIVFIVLFIVVVIGIDLINISVRCSQIGSFLNSEFDEVSFSLKGARYAYGVGACTGKVPFGDIGSKKDVFYLHDNKNDFDFTVSNYDGRNMATDYYQKWSGKKIADLCISSVKIPDGCEIENINCFCVLYKDSEVSPKDSYTVFKNLSGNELREKLSDKNSGFKSGQIKCYIKLKGEEKAAKKLSDSIIDFLYELSGDIDITEVQINGQTQLNYTQTENGTDLNTQLQSQK